MIVIGAKGIREEIRENNEYALKSFSLTCRTKLFVQHIRKASIPSMRLQATTSSQGG